MHILYVGPISLDIVTRGLPFGEVLDDTECRFDLGAYQVLEFHKRGHEVTVVKLTNLINSPRVLATEGFTIQLFPERPTREQYRGFYHKEVKVLSAAIRESKPDVVFANWPYQFARAGLVSGCPTLVVAHDSPWRILWLMRDKSRLLRTFYSQFLVMPRTRYMTGVSPYILDDIRKFCFYRRKIRCIPNAVTRDVPKVCAKEIRQEATTIFAISDWGRLKNIMALLRAFVLLRARHPSWRLIVCGHGLERGGEAEKLMKAEGLSVEGIEFRGFQSRQELDRGLAQEADVFCSPTLEESFGLVFIEAMVLGVPCVGGEKSGAVSWVMDEGGVACDVRKPERLAACLERVMGDWELRKRLSAAGVERVRTEFSLRKCVDRYLDALTCVANGGKGW